MSRRNRTWLAIAGVMLGLLWAFAVQQRAAAGMQGWELVGFAALSSIVPALMFLLVLARVRSVDRAQRDRAMTIDGDAEARSTTR